MNSQIPTGPADALQEPPPLWPGAPRYCPKWELPPYSFVAGRSPHPIRDPRGHSFGLPESKAVHLPPERWRENRPYLRGIDLYHHGYFWEAHEVWEHLWKLVDRHGVEGRFLQGLILLSAAQLKRNVGSAPGVRKASWLAWNRLREARDRGGIVAGERFMGIDLDDLLAQVERYYGPHWPDGSLRGIALRGDPPHLDLAPWEDR